MFNNNNLTEIFDSVFLGGYYFIKPKFILKKIMKMHAIMKNYVQHILHILLIATLRDVKTYFQLNLTTVAWRLVTIFCLISQEQSNVQLN